MAAGLWFNLHVVMWRVKLKVIGLRSISLGAQNTATSTDNFFGKVKTDKSTPVMTRTGTEKIVLAPTWVLIISYTV